MVNHLSSNWKQLQCKIKAEADKPPNKKRSRDEPSLKRNSSEPPAAKKPRLARLQKSSQYLSRMGNAQSSQPDTTCLNRTRPYTSFLPGENAVSSEDIAEEFGLGVYKNSLLQAGPERVNEGRAASAQPGKYVALDCEMVGVGPGGYESALARISIVDFHGRQVYDSFVRPMKRVTDWRTHVTGITSKHMPSARSFEDVQQDVAELIKDRILVGHDLKHDLEVLLLSHPPRLRRDTALFSGFKQYGPGPKPALRTLADRLLGIDIHSGEHSSIEDARVSMALFRRHKSAFDVEHSNRFGDSQQIHGGTKKTKPKGTRKKK